MTFKTLKARPQLKADKSKHMHGTILFLSAALMQFSSKSTSASKRIMSTLSLSANQLYSTKVLLPISNALKIDHQSPLTFIGSCFSESMADELRKRKFDVVSNPQGILFNPASISMCIDRIVTRHCFDESDIFPDAMDSEVFHSWHHGREFSGTNVGILDRMNSELEEGHKHLVKSAVLFITFGTNVAYKHKIEGTIVSNCHKQPGTNFEKIHLEVDDVVHCMSESIRLLRSVNPNIKVVFTVSPVRHTRGGLVENSLSKSTLICAAHRLIKMFPYISYFPSYEIVIDELRDYRWFETDMIHPTQLTKDIIFSKFSDYYLSPPTQAFNQKIESLRKNIEHRPIIQRSNVYRNHLNMTLSSIYKILEDPISEKANITFTDEIAFCFSAIAASSSQGDKS